MRVPTAQLLVPLLLVPMSLFALACNGDDDNDAAATSIPSVAVPTESPVAESTATTAPAASATSEPTTAPTATSEPTLPPTDGTVFPQNPGSTDAFPLKSLPDPNTGIYVLNDVRVGAHPESGGWDRIVFEFEPVDGFPGAHPGGIVEYVDEALQCGSGEPVDVEGNAILRVKLDATQAHDNNGNLTIDAIEIEGPGNSIIQAVSFCDFEGIVEWAIGVPAEQNFKVVYLQEPSRIVIDIKWP